MKEFVAVMLRQQLGVHPCPHPSVKKTTRAAPALCLHHEDCAVAHRPLCVKQPKGTCLLAFVCIRGRQAIPKGSSIANALLTKLPETLRAVHMGSSIAHDIEASGTCKLKPCGQVPAWQMREQQWRGRSKSCGKPVLALQPATHALEACL